jgi:hypothetical protein
MAVKQITTPKLGTIIKNRIRGSTFGLTQFADTIQGKIEGAARESQIGAQKQSLGMGRKPLGGMRGRRLKQKALRGQQLARTGELRTIPGFAKRDVRQMNVGGPGRTPRGPKVN